MSARPAFRSARRPALFLWNGIGDHFLSLPAVRAIAGLFPGRLTVIGQRGIGRTIFHGIRFKKFCDVAMAGDAGSQRQFDADSLARRVGRCDLLISLNPWQSPPVDRLLARLAPESSIGFFREFERRVTLDRAKHSADLTFDIVRALDPTRNIDAFAQAPRFAPRFVQQAARVRRAFPAGCRVLAVHAETRRQKMWPARRFVSLLDSFLERQPDFLAVVVGSSDLGLDRGRHGRRVIPVHGLPLATSALLVGSADLFVGIDSSMLHAADLFRVPGVGLFGPTSPAEWGFRFSRHRHLRARGRMSTLSENRVLEALEELL
jgi:hypothetical protein